MSARPLTCRRCKSDELVYIETCEEHAEVVGLWVDHRNRLVSNDVGSKQPGEVIRRRVECQSCGHAWTPRRPFDPFGTPREAPR